MKNLPYELLSHIFTHNSCKDQKNLAAVSKSYYNLLASPSLTLFKFNSPITTYTVGTISIVLTRLTKNNRIDHNTHKLSVYDKGKRVTKLGVYMDKKNLEIILRNMEQGPDILIQKLHKEIGSLKRIANYLSGIKDEPLPSYRYKRRV